MKTVRLSHPTKILNGIINLPASKSISNRSLVLKHIIGSTIELQNLSTADDTIIMQQALEQGIGMINLKNAGTCMRFLTAYFAAKNNCEVTLLCDERMEKRPISALVNALTQLGADITYLKQDGFPPLHIKGKQLTGGNIEIEATESSQFVSAILMIAPLCKTDLTIEITGNITSQPYIDMTVKMMQKFGLNVEHTNSTVKCPMAKKNPISTIQFPHFMIEPDWSAASYWYQLVALSIDAEITLKNLSLTSLQGDSNIAQYMNIFDVQTLETKNGITLKKKISSTVNTFQFLNNKPQTINLTNCPDLAPTIAVTAAATNTALVLTGLQNLTIKESNRIDAITRELTKLGFDIAATNDTLTVNRLAKNSQLKQQPEIINTYSDHRIAMAFAPLALVFDTITVENPDAVEKSYPHFWDDLKKVGFDSC